MAITVKLLRSEVCTFKERYSVASEKDILWTLDTPVPASTTSGENNQSIERKPGSERPTTLSDKEL